MHSIDTFLLTYVLGSLMPRPIFPVFTFIFPTQNTRKSKPIIKKKKKN